MSDVVLPAGVSAASFDRALQEFRKILGDEHVLVGFEQTVSYRKIQIAIPELQVAPSGALLPGSVEEVRAILKVCNLYKIPVWPISTGKNFGYGSAAPATKGQMVLDLRRMNRIIEVDPELGTALVEPGVTYRQLRDYLDEKGYKLWIDVPSPSAIVGPVGNTLERGVGYTPYGDHFMMACGMEVVLADGQVLRTGMGGVAGSNSWQSFKWGYGPYLDGIFTQSNFGVVTKLGFFLMPEPPLFRPFAVRYADNSDLAKVVETMRPLRIAGLVPGGGIIQSPLYEVSIVHKRRDIYDGPGPIPEDIIEREAKKLGLSAWNLYAGIYAGTDEQLAANWNIIAAAFKASGGRIELESDMPEKARALFARPKELMRGGLTLDEFSMYNFRGGGGSMWFAPVAPAKGSEVVKQTGMAKDILHKYGFDYICGWVVGWRELHHIMDLLFDRNNPEEMHRAYRCFDELVTTFAKAGYGIYRTNTAFMDKVAETFGPEQRDINRRIKRALDPNGILAPGKSGIHL